MKDEKAEEFMKELADEIPEELSEIAAAACCGWWCSGGIV